MDPIRRSGDYLSVKDSTPAVLAERERIAASCEREANELRPSDWKKAFGSDTEAGAECTGQIDALEMIAGLLRGSIVVDKGEDL